MPPPKAEEARVLRLRRSEPRGEPRAGQRPSRRTLIAKYTVLAINTGAWEVARSAWGERRAELTGEHARRAGAHLAIHPPPTAPATEQSGTRPCVGVWSGTNRANIPLKCGSLRPHKLFCDRVRSVRAPTREQRSRFTPLSSSTALPSFYT